MREAGAGYNFFAFESVILYLLRAESSVSHEVLNTYGACQVFLHPTLMTDAHLQELGRRLQTQWLALGLQESLGHLGTHLGTISDIADDPVYMSFMGRLFAVMNGLNAENQFLACSAVGVAIVAHVRHFGMHARTDRRLIIPDNDLLILFGRRFMSAYAALRTRSPLAAFAKHYAIWLRWSFAVVPDAAIHDVGLGSNIISLIADRRWPPYATRAQSIPAYLLEMLTLVDEIDEQGRLTGNHRSVGTDGGFLGRDARD